MLRFYRDQYHGRVGKIFVESIVSVDKWVGIGWGFYLLALACLTHPAQKLLMSTWEGMPIWVVLAFVVASVLVLFVRGLLRENYKNFQKVETERREIQDEKARLEERLTTEERRKAVKRALAHAALVGDRLHNDKPTTEQYESWSNLVAAMIWFAFEDFGQVRLFYNDFEVFIDILTEDSDAKQAIRRRLKYIHKLIPRVDTLNLSPTFDAREWIGHRPPHMKTPAKAQEVFNRAKEIQGDR